jgi:hypothetical protein
MDRYLGQFLRTNNEYGVGQRHVRKSKKFLRNFGRDFGSRMK